MKKTSRFMKSATGLLAVVFLVTALYVAVQTPSTAQRSDFAKLSLRISSTKGLLAELEPIPIILNLRNESNEKAVGHSALELSDNFVKLFIIEEGGAAREIQDLSPITANTVAAPREIGPGESVEAKQALAFHLDKTFPRPGNYRIQAVLYDAKWSNKIQSNILPIHIVEPEGQDFEALNYIRSIGAASYFFSGVGFSDEHQQREALEDFTARFGDTLYGDYVVFLLGERYFYNNENARAKLYLDRLAGKPDFIFANKVADYRKKLAQRDTTKQ